MIRGVSIAGRPARSDVRRDRAVCGGSGLPSLRGSPLVERFRAWTGRSGRRYVVSVFPPGTAMEDLPLACGAVLLAVRREPPGGCRLVWGAAIEPQGIPPAGAEGAELHLHLLAAGTRERAAMLADIGARSPQAVAMSLGPIAPLAASGASMNPPDWRRQRSA